MGIFDIDEDTENFSDNNFILKEDNKYLSNDKEAIKLISNILSISRDDISSKNTIKKIDYMLDTNFLSAFKEIQLTNEAQLQIKLTLLSDKLIEQKKNWWKI